MDYGSINGRYAQTSQHGFPFPKADIAVTEFLKHKGQTNDKFQIIAMSLSDLVR